jgi:hypothetical protein
LVQRMREAGKKQTARIVVLENRCTEIKTVQPSQSPYGTPRDGMLIPIAPFRRDRPGFDNVLRVPIIAFERL